MVCTTGGVIIISLLPVSEASWNFPPPMFVQALTPKYDNKTVLKANSYSLAITWMQSDTQGYFGIWKKKEFGPLNIRDVHGCTYKLLHPHTMTKSMVKQQESAM